jgi:hypothetical protein
MVASASALPTDPRVTNVASASDLDSFLGYGSTLQWRRVRGMIPCNHPFEKMKSRILA